jgi:hypothetical protein
LKDPKVAPAIQGAKVPPHKRGLPSPQGKISAFSDVQAELEKAKLEDDLSKKLANRPVPEELIKEKILNRIDR